MLSFSPLPNIHYLYLPFLFLLTKILFGNFVRNLSSHFFHSVCLLSPVLGSFVCGVHTDYGCEVSVWRFTADLVTVLLFPRSPAPAHYGSFLVTIVSFYTAEPHNYLLPIGTHRDKGWKMSQHPQNYFKRFVVWTRPQHFTILGNKILSALALISILKICI